MRRIILCGLLIAIVGCSKNNEKAETDKIEASKVESGKVVATTNVKERQPWEWDIHSEKDTGNVKQDDIKFLETNSKSVDNKTKTLSKSDLERYQELTKKYPTNVVVSQSNNTNRQEIDEMRKLGNKIRADAQRDYNKSVQDQNNQMQKMEYDARLNAQAEQKRKQALIDKVSQPIPGSKGLTRSQIEAIASIQNGTPMPSHNDTPNNTPQHNLPQNVANCDGAGCNGTGGERYNNNGIGGYTSTNGKSCQSIGGQMHCY